MTSVPQIAADSRHFVVVISSYMTGEKDMWLPTPIYERLPQFLLVLGLLLMSSGAYLGFDYAWSFLYFGVGFGGAAWSLWLFSVRSAARKKASEQAEQHEDADRDAETPA